MRRILAVLACLFPVAAFAQGASLPPGLMPGKNLSDLPSASAARINLGIGPGTLATLGVGANLTSSGGTLSLTSSGVAGALGYTPYNASNPANYITSVGAPVQTVFGRSGAVSLLGSDVTGALGYTPLSAAGGTLSGPLTAPGITSTGNASVAGTLGVTGAVTSGPLTTVGVSGITAGSGSNDQIVITPTAPGAVPSITALGSDGLKLTAQNGGSVFVAGGSPLNIGNGFTYTVSGAVSPLLQQNFNITGTATGNPALLYSGGLFLLNSDTLHLPGVNQGFNGWQFEHNLAAGFTGNRHAMEVSLIQNGTSGNTIASGTIGYYTAVLGYSIASANDNGTGLTSTTAHGRAFAANFNAELHSGATNYFQATALELNAEIDTGASALVRSFLSVSPVAGAVQGSQVDAGIWFYSAGGALIKTGILFGGGSLNQWAIDPAGTLIGADASGSITAQAAWGMDLSQVTFSGGFLKSTGFVVDGAGNTTVASLKVGATAGVTCTGTPTSSFASVGGVVTHC